VAPLDRRFERLLPGRCAARAADQQGEAIVETALDLARRERAQPRRRELERQGDAVEALAERAQGGLVGGVEGKARPDLAAALEEQPQRIVLAELGKVPDDLACDRKRLAAGRQQRDLGTAREQRAGQLGGGVEHVLAVVETEQQPPGGELRRQRGRRALHRLDEHAERGGHLLAHAGRIGDAGQLHPPDAVAPASGLLGGGMRGEAGLTAAARSADRHQTLGGEQPVQLGELVTAADEARQLDRQVVRTDVERAQRRRRPIVAGAAQLEDPLGVGQVAQPVDAAVAQGGARRQDRLRQRRGRGRHDGLAAVRAVAQLLRTAQRGAGVAPVVPDLGVAGVQREPHLLGRRAAAEVPHRHDGRDSVGDVVEDRDEPLARSAGRAPPAMRRGSLVDRRLQGGGRWAQPLRPGGGVEVGDQEGDRAGHACPVCRMATAGREIGHLADVLRAALAKSSVVPATNHEEQNHGRRHR
jgi:hypothetical protein